jgi:hypothetical protein
LSIVAEGYGRDGKGVAVDWLGKMLFQGNSIPKKEPCPWNEL